MCARAYDSPSRAPWTVRFDCTAARSDACAAARRRWRGAAAQATAAQQRAGSSGSGPERGALQPALPSRRQTEAGQEEASLSPGRFCRGAAAAYPALLRRKRDAPQRASAATSARHRAPWPPTGSLAATGGWQGCSASAFRFPEDGAAGGSAARAGAGTARGRDTTAVRAERLAYARRAASAPQPQPLVGDGGHEIACRQLEASLGLPFGLPAEVCVDEPAAESEWEQPPPRAADGSPAPALFGETALRLTPEEDALRLRVWPMRGGRSARQAQPACRTERAASVFLD